MHVEVKSSSGTSLVPIETRNFTSRIIYLKGEVNGDMACDFVEQVLYLNKEDDTLPITVLIHSPGGEIDAGMLIYDVIQSSKAPIRTVCTGRAYSMGAVLLASGTGGRYILPHSKTMLHEPLISNGVGGSCSSIRSMSDSLIETRRMINELLSKHTGKSVEEIETATSYDHYFSAEESVEFGLVDGIIPFHEFLK